MFIYASFMLTQVLQHFPSERKLDSKRGDYQMEQFGFIYAPLSLWDRKASQNRP